MNFKIDDKGGQVKVSIQGRPDQFFSSGCSFELFAYCNHHITVEQMLESGSRALIESVIRYGPQAKQKSLEQLEDEVEQILGAPQPEQAQQPIINQPVLSDSVQIPLNCSQTLTTDDVIKLLNGCKVHQVAELKYQDLHIVMKNDNPKRDDFDNEILYGSTGR